MAMVRRCATHYVISKWPVPKQELRKTLFFTCFYVLHWWPSPCSTLFCLSGLACWSVARLRVWPVPNSLTFIRMAEGGTWNGVKNQNERKLLHDMYWQHVWHHCPKFHKVWPSNLQAKRSVDPCNDIHHITARLRSLTVGLLRLAAHCFVYRGWHAGRLPPPLSPASRAQPHGISCPISNLEGSSAMSGSIKFLVNRELHSFQLSNTH